jgi:dTDP-4-amino-4,6-dideoxy-D-galactose acyltransferase
MITKLVWDSQFFEMEIGELYFENNKALFNKLRSEDFDLLYVKSNEDFELDINNFKIEFSETKVIFMKNLEMIHPKSTNIFSANEIDYNLNEIYELAYESGKHSRFRLDNNFQNQKFEELYKKWIDNSILNIFADDLLIYQENNQTMGFVTYKVNENSASIGLIAIKPDFQGKGIGGKLLNFVENTLFHQNINKLLIPTQQTNEAACNFYKKQDYKVHETTFIKHYWKNDTI